jgi:RimJ/RimL family protein N-acetyltransferase
MPAVTARLIRTARLDLQPLRVTHAAEMAGVLADPGLYSFTGGRPPTAAGLRARYQRWGAGAPDPAVSWCNWVIRLRAERRLVGTGLAGTGLVGTVQATITGPAGARAAEIAWVVGAAWQGRGIGGEAARGLVGWLRQLPVRTITAYIHPDHHASAGVARAAGLAPTRRRRDGEVRWQLEISGPP